MSEPRNATITYPGGLRSRWRWGGSGSAAEVFALTEAGGSLVDLGPLVAPEPDELCRAELHVEGPRGAWTVRFASLIHDDPRALHWDTAGLLIVAYGFHTYGLDAASGEHRWDHRSATPIIALHGSSRLAHVLVQSGAWFNWSGTCAGQKQPMWQSNRSRSTGWQSPAVPPLTSASHPGANTNEHPRGIWTPGACCGNCSATTSLSLSGGPAARRSRAT